MNLIPLHNPMAGPMRIAAFMSGSGSNLEKILEHEKDLENELGQSPYKVVVIFSDNPRSKAVSISAKYDLPVLTRSIRAFYESKNQPKENLNLRVEFDSRTVKSLRPFAATVIAYAGYMSIVTKPLIDAYLGVNVHPADLSLLDAFGKRKYTGAKAVMNAVYDGQREIRSTTHLVEEEVDCGKILMISPPVKIGVGRGSRDFGVLFPMIKQYQEKLKQTGDWVIFPLTLQYIAEGRYAKDLDGNLYFDRKPIPFGIRLD